MDEPQSFSFLFFTAKFGPVGTLLLDAHVGLLCTKYIF